MGRILIACETLKDEFEMVMNTLNIHIPVHWMSNALHSSPDKLRRSLQDILNTTTDYPYILLGFGNCGNGLVGLQASSSTLIIPRFDDCIDMLLCKNTHIDSIRNNTYFLTKGWLRGESPVTKEFNYQLEKYGEKHSRRILEILYHNYAYLMMIRTGTYEPSEILDEISPFLRLSGLTLIEGDGDLSILEKLLLGHWDEQFSIIPPGQQINNGDFKNLSKPIIH
ncbi:MAG: DUF1638 domain-containing protein [Eubacterium sp.]